MEDGWILSEGVSLEVRFELNLEERGNINRRILQTEGQLGGEIT